MTLQIRSRIEYQLVIFLRFFYNQHWLNNSWAGFLYDVLIVRYGGLLFGPLLRYETERITATEMPAEQQHHGVGVTALSLAAISNHDESPSGISLDISITDYVRSNDSCRSSSSSSTSLSCRIFSKPNHSATERYLRFRMKQNTCS